MRTVKGEALHLLLLVSDLSNKAKLLGQFIIGDNTFINVGIVGGVTTGVASLMMAYYIFNVNFPKQIYNTMSILDEVIMGGSSVNRKMQSLKAKEFLPILKKEMSRVKQSTSKPQLYEIEDSS